LQAGGHRFDPGQLHQITGIWIENRQDRITAQCWAPTQRRFGADHWTGQASNQRSTPSYVERWLQGKSRKVKARKGQTKKPKPEAMDQSKAAQAAQVWQQTVGRYLTTE
jgi:hypothetical protein